MALDLILPISGEKESPSSLVSDFSPPLPKKLISRRKEGIPKFPRSLVYRIGDCMLSLAYPGHGSYAFNL